MKIVRIASGGLLLSLLAGCQSMDGGKPAELAVAPVEDVRHGFSRPEAMYAIGRYLQGQMLYDKAIVAYRRLLAAYPGHAEAHNALGLILASQGRYDAAIAEFEIAATDAPDSAGIRNNLGYAYLLQDRLEEAVAALRTAGTLDPANRRVADNLATALARSEAKLARAAAAAEAGAGPASAAAVPVPVLPVTVESSAAPASNSSATPASNAVAALESNSGIVPATPVAGPTRQAPVETNTPTLPAASDLPSAYAAQASVATPGGVAKSARLEVSNANGITGLARRTSYQLTAAGYGKARLTNEPPYQLAATQIQYRPGFETQANTLRTVLRQEVALVKSAALRFDVQLRLVLGKDVKSPDYLVARLD